MMKILIKEEIVRLLKIIGRDLVLRLEDFQIKALTLAEEQGTRIFKAFSKITLA
jgi:hypothetical protein